MKNLKRLVVPLGMVLGTLVCAYIGFFVGVKDDFPQPPGAERYPLSTIKQATVVKAWPEAADFKAPDVSVYTLREPPSKAVQYYRDAFITRRGWTEIAPPGQPSGLGPDQQFTMLAFRRGNTRIFIALSPARPIYQADTELNKAIRSNNIREDDNIAIVIAER